MAITKHQYRELQYDFVRNKVNEEITKIDNQLVSQDQKSFVVTGDLYDRIAPLVSDEYRRNGWTVKEEDIEVEGYTEDRVPAVKLTFS